MTTFPFETVVGPLVKMLCAAVASTTITGASLKISIGTDDAPSDAPRIERMALSSDGKSVVGITGPDFYGYDRLVIWNLKSGKVMSTIPLSAGVHTALSLHPKRNVIATGAVRVRDTPEIHESGIVSVWELHTGKCIWSVRAHSSYITSVGFSSDGRVLLSASWDDTITASDGRTGRKLYSIDKHKGSVNSIAIANSPLKNSRA